jgi:hypothetical protein
MATSLYETDIYAWSQQQVALLRAEDFAEVDWHNVIEEIDSLGVSQRNELKNRLKELLMHLLKWQFQPDKQSPSWYKSIKMQRNAINDLLDDNPSLRRLIDESVDSVYHRAVRDAIVETGLPRAIFPTTCPYASAQVMDDEFFPFAEQP